MEVFVAFRNRRHYEANGQPHLVGVFSTEQDVLELLKSNAASFYFPCEVDYGLAPLKAGLRAYSVHEGVAEEITAGTMPHVGLNETSWGTDANHALAFHAALEEVRGAAK